MSKATHLWLDDMRDAPRGYALARTVAEATALLRRGTFRVVSLDGDLSATDPTHTGLDVVRWLAREVKEGRLRAPKVTSHSGDPALRCEINREALALGGWSMITGRVVKDWAVGATGHVWVVLLSNGKQVTVRRARVGGRIIGVVEGDDGDRWAQPVGQGAGPMEIWALSQKS